MTNLMGKPQQPILSPEIEDALKKVGSLSERSRLIEERMKQTREKMQVLDETFSSKVKDLRTVTSNLEEQMALLRKDLDETKEILRRIVKDVGSAAKLSDVRVLEKYINMIDFTRLVTKQDVEEIINEKLKKKS